MIDEVISFVVGMNVGRFIFTVKALYLIDMNNLDVLPDLDGKSLFILAIDWVDEHTTDIVYMHLKIGGLGLLIVVLL